MSVVALGFSERRLNIFGTGAIYIPCTHRQHGLYGSFEHAFGDSVFAVFLPKPACSGIQDMSNTTDAAHHALFGGVANPFSE